MQITSPGKNIMIKATEVYYEITRRGYNTCRRLRLMPEKRLSSQDTGAFSKTPTPHTCARNPGVGEGRGGRGRGLLWMSEANVLSARKELKEPVNFHTVEKRHARAC